MQDPNDHSHTHDDGNTSEKEEPETKVTEGEGGIVGPSEEEI